MAQNDSTSKVNSGYADHDKPFIERRPDIATTYVCVGRFIRNWKVAGKGEFETAGISLFPLYSDTVSRLWDLLEAGNVGGAVQYLLHRDVDGNELTKETEDNATYLQSVACAVAKFDNPSIPDGNSNVELNQKLIDMLNRTKRRFTPTSWVHTWLSEFGLYTIRVAPVFHAAKEGVKGEGITLYYVQQFEKLDKRPLTLDELPHCSISLGEPAAPTNKRGKNRG